MNDRENIFNIETTVEDEAIRFRMRKYSEGRRCGIALKMQLTELEHLSPVEAAKHTAERISLMCQAMEDHESLRKSNMDKHLEDQMNELCNSDKPILSAHKKDKEP